MRNRLKFVAVIASLCCAGSLISGAIVAADQPSVSKGVAKQLKAAQEAAAAKHYDEALSKIKEAQAASGEKTAFDNYAIDVILIQIYQGKNDQAGLAQTLQTAAQSQYVPNEQQKAWYKYLAQYYYQQKDYAKSIEAAQADVRHGASDSDTLLLIGKAEFQSGKYKDASAQVQDVVGKMEKPDEDSLKLEWTFCDKAGDSNCSAKTIEKLVAFYPKPEYWQNALAPMHRMDIKDSHLQLDVYRLMNDVGVLRLPTDYADMAEISMDQGLPGETVAILQEAFQKNIFTEQRDKDRYQHLLDGAKQRAATDQAQLGKSEPADGNGYVQQGVAYMSYGQYDKAVASISKGIQKGGLKSPEDATMLLGIADLKSRNNAEAQKAFEKVASSGSQGYSRLAKLWALHAGARGAPVGVAKNEH